MLVHFWLEFLRRDVSFSVHPIKGSMALTCLTDAVNPWLRQCPLGFSTATSLSPFITNEYLERDTLGLHKYPVSL